MSTEEKVVLEEQPAVEVVQETMDQIIFDPEAPVVTLKKLLEAGVHFGHPTRKWNPKMKPFIYGARNNIYIIDLAKTAEQIASAYNALKAIVDNGGKVLFVGTKKQIGTCVEEQALRSGSFYVNTRWLGGTLTNFSCIQKRIRYLKDLEKQDAEGLLSLKTKKEASIIRKEMEKLTKNLDGIKEMRKIPEAMIVVDPSIEYNAIREANRLHIPVFAIVDTNSDPDNVNYVIPGNDDAVKSVKLLLSILADAIVESKGGTPTVAHAKVAEADVTMKDAIKQVDKENAARLAAIREQKRLRKEAYEKQMAERDAKAKNGEKRPNKGPRKPHAPKAAPATEAPVEAPVAETKVEETKGE